MPVQDSQPAVAPNASAPSTDSAPSSAPQVPSVTKEQVLDDVRHAKVFIEANDEWQHPQQSAKSEAVRSTQNDLNNWLKSDSGKTWLQSDQGKAWAAKGGESLDANGAYDARTVELVRGFQSQFAKEHPDIPWASKVDGIIGPRTMRALDMVSGREDKLLPYNEFRAALVEEFSRYYSESSGGSCWERPKNLQPLSKDFYEGVQQIAKQIGAEPSWVEAVMKFESNINPQARNGQSGATGLIQFLPSTARSLGTSVEELSHMTREEQLPYVRDYFLKTMAERGISKVDSIDQLYMLVLQPSAANKGANDSIFSAGSMAYSQNAGLDRDGDGRVTKHEAAARVRQLAQNVNPDNYSEAAVPSPVG